MLSLFKYSAVFAKTRVMSGRLIDSNDYENLIKAKSVNEICAYLKNNTEYNSVLKDINEHTIHRGNLEKILKHELLEDYKKIFSFMTGKTEKFFRLAYLKYEIEDLKLLFRVLETKGNTKLAEESLLFLAKYNTLNIPKLAESRNTHEFIENLKGTKYFRILREFLIDESNINLFNIEMTLDMYFFKLIWEAKEKYLSQKDKKIINQTLGRELDTINLLWIYRAKKYYNLEKEVIYNYTIPVRHKINSRLMTRLIEASDENEVLNIIKGTQYREIFSDKWNIFYELDYRKMMYRLHKSFFRKEPYSVACISSYFHLREYELSNIISIIEGIRYALPHDEIRKFVVGID